MKHHPAARLFKDPRIQYPKNNITLSFSDYITKCKSLIATTRIDLSQSNADHIIETNTPFELKPHADQKAKAGVLLIHGLLDSAFQLKEIGLHLQSQGFLVRSLLLPGHGTVPGALLHIDYQEWIETVKYGISSLQKEVEQIILVGNSTGGSLALHQAIENNANIAGVILISPAIKINSKFAPIANLPHIVGKALKPAAWFHKDPEETIDYAKYLSLPYNAVYQVYRLSRELAALKKPTTPCPLLFIVSDTDKIICPKAIINYFEQHKNPESKLLLYTDSPQNTQDKRIRFRTGSYPNQGIINLSHIALPYSPNNPHYGTHGDYKYASHVDAQKNIVYGEFLRNDLYYHRWKARLRLTESEHQRLTFNPDFATMLETIHHFAEQSLTHSYA